jgi:hypothetical protein
MDQAAMNRICRIAIATLVSIAPFAALVAQTDDKPKGEAQKIEKLSEWPALKETDKDRVLAMVGQFRKADPALHEAATKQLLAIGEAGMPLMFQQVSDNPNNVNTQLFAVFDTLLEPKHAALMARESKKQKVALRRYLIQRLCRFTDSEMLPVLASAAKDKDPETAFYAALGGLALKQREQLPAVLTYSKNHWREVVAICAEVLPTARSNEVGSWVFEAIAKAPAAEQMAGLRLARYLAVKDHTIILRGYLQAADGSVKKEAVNTMRVMHGEAPMENLSVFQAIEMAKEWLNKA